MNIAVLGETVVGENRVALIPSSVPKLVKLGYKISVVAGAGSKSHYQDSEYEQVGATICPDLASATNGASIILKVQPPTDQEIASLPKNSVLISLLLPLNNPDLIKSLADASITALSLELIPRITRAQSMDVLSSQATVAGYKAVLTGSNELGKFLPMFMTAAGTIRPGKVLILGAGVAGLQAIATARRLGAKVEAFDVRPAVKEQIESLGATFLEMEEEVSGEGEGGYAKELSEDQHLKELELIATHVSDADLVITTAQIPGKPAPELITEAMVKSMKPGSVIVDLAASTGGNCRLTEEGETVLLHGVKLIGPANLPSEVPVHASQMFSKNVETLLKELVKEGELSLDFSDEVVTGTCVSHAGEVRHQLTREKLGLK
jgi:NAD(P) transhydrogenase subunit alpha|tara:strand:+ start:2575 stop:3708 length:1134 start_codon:yes stop_codon:yes gene_type:complete